jgi:hypothetical protein
LFKKPIRFGQIGRRMDCFRKAFGIRLNPEIKFRKVQREFLQGLILARSGVLLKFLPIWRLAKLETGLAFYFRKFTRIFEWNSGFSENLRFQNFGG